MTVNLGENRSYCKVNYVKRRKEDDFTEKSSHQKLITMVRLFILPGDDGASNILPE